MKIKKRNQLIETLALVKTGTLGIEAGERYNPDFTEYRKQFLKSGDSSVVRITFGGKHYLVDTGYADEWNLEPASRELNKAMLNYHLTLQRLSFESIAGIFITHWHHDHFGNLPFFPNARLYTTGPEKGLNLEVLAEKCGFTHMMPPSYCGAGDTFAGCTLLPTPGHTPDHCSLLAEYGGWVFCIAGDAIVSQSYYERGEAWPYNAGNMGKEKCAEAMNAIIESSDYIIPGHGHVFQNYRRKTGMR
ncbi:MAG: MBL fold metallo-hydrolase [Spirochaetales bacterium]|nr:MBL fold metallo-hydrolase [Spirochaetales bacterium]